MPDLLSFSLQRKLFMKYQQPPQERYFFAALQILNTPLQVDTFFATCCCLACKHTIRLKHNMNSSHSYYTRTAQVLHWLMAIIFIGDSLILALHPPCATTA